MKMVVFVLVMTSDDSAVGNVGTSFHYDDDDDDRDSRRENDGTVGGGVDGSGICGGGVGLSLLQRGADIPAVVLRGCGLWFRRRLLIDSRPRHAHSHTEELHLVRVGVSLPVCTGVYVSVGQRVL